MTRSWRRRALLALSLLTPAGAGATQDACPAAADRSTVEQMLIVKVPEASGASKAAFLDWLAGRNIGGVYLSKRSTRGLGSPAEVREYVADLQSDRVTGLFVSVDQEGGAWQGLDPANGFAALPSATDLCATAEGEAIAEYARRDIGEPLAAAGVNMNFAPVLDVALNPDSDIIVRKRRACSDDPARVAAYGRAIADGLMRAGVIPVGKHFPGHGDVAGDTHHAAVVSGKSLARLEAEDLVPFAAFLEGEGPAVMVSHIVVTAVDDSAPASLSRPVVSGMLRTRYGFAGLVITDDLGMKAVKAYSDGRTAQAAEQAIRAGADLLIVAHARADDVVDEICRALDGPDGAVLRGSIAAANARIRNTKRRFGIATPDG